jgi:nonsense-mediated mRNA decay protein 3
VIDPTTGQTGTIESDAYWRDPFRPVATAARTRLTRYVVLGKDPVFLERNTSKKGVNKKQRSKLALITAARESDLGSNNSQLEERSHLGYLMKSGDICLGYDLRECQLVDDEAEEERVAGKFPDLIIVRKLYGGVATGESDSAKKRTFRLQRLEVKKGGEEDNARGKKVKKEVEMEQMDEEDFLQELEADKEMRTRVNIYKSDIVLKDDDNVDDEDDDDEDDQKITLDELLDNLVLDAKPDAEDDPEMQGEVASDVAEGQEGMKFVIEEGERAAKDNIGYVGRDEALHIQAKDTAIPVNVWGKEFMEKDVKLS